MTKVEAEAARLIEKVNALKETSDQLPKVLEALRTRAGKSRPLEAPDETPAKPCSSTPEPQVPKTRKASEEGGVLGCAHCPPHTIARAGRR